MCTNLLTSQIRLNKIIDNLIASSHVKLFVILFKCFSSDIKLSESGQFKLYAK